MNELRYSIKDLENFTQIKAHTIRIWEQRYGLLSPKRTDTNIRYYNEDDLKKILNINLLYTSGQKISKISLLSNDEIIEKSKCEFEIEWTLNAVPYLTKKTNLLNIIQSALKKVNSKEAVIDNGGGTSDGRWVSPSGAEVIELGPINKTIHQIDEKISLSDLDLLTRIYNQILVETNSDSS